MATIIIQPLGLEHLILLPVLGWMLGLVINYFSDVLPISRKLSPATCFTCAQNYRLLDYVLLRRCAHCRAKRSTRTWAVQVAAFAALILIAVFPMRRLEFWIAALLFGYFSVVFVIDLEYKLILHPVSLVGAVGGAVLGIKLNGLEATILGGLAGFGIMFLLYYLGVLFLRVYKKAQASDEESALGFGDVFLSAVIGLMVGWMDILGSLIIAILLGGLVSGIYIMIAKMIKGGYRPMTAIPYGPFLLIGAAFYLFVPSFYYI